MDIPTGVAFKIGSITFVDGEIPSTPTGDPANARDTTPANTGMTVGTIEYSTTGTAGPWTTTTPTADYLGTYNTTIRAIRITPAGTMNDGAFTTVGLRVYYKGIIQ